MLKQIEGSLGVAEAVALCRPEIICAYPISPQTHIVENLGAMVKKGTLEDCEFLNVESEFAAHERGNRRFRRPAAVPTPLPLPRGCFIWLKRFTTPPGSVSRSL